MTFFHTTVVFWGLVLLSTPSKVTCQTSALRFSRHINTSANEYLPCPTPEGTRMFFCGMDRTGYFDFKLNFIEYPNSGGEDVFYTELENGIWTDARPVKSINTNGHESISQVLSDGSFLMAANYPENIGIQQSNDGLETADLFKVFGGLEGTPRIQHLPEPVNSIWTEADAWEQNGTLLFVSDRPTQPTSNYHMKGWQWNGHLWGNTDVFVAFQGDFGWESVIRLPEVINTPGPERTPRLSQSGLKLWLSTWVEGEGLNIVEFRRKDANNWKEWDGPYPLTSINTKLDDWGYIETQNGAFWSRAVQLSLDATAVAPGGNSGGFRETNFRTGYAIFGRQTASFQTRTQTDIFWMPPSKSPDHFSFDEVLFEFDSDNLSVEGLRILDAFADMCMMNKNYQNLIITGHTDQTGTVAYNRELSLRRAKAVETYLRQAQVPQSLSIQGVGFSQPKASNDTEAGRAENRRVSFRFETTAD